MSEENILHTDGGVSLFTGEPFVTGRVGKETWQWTPAEAREFAVLLIRTAAAAEADADIVAVLRKIELEDEVIGVFLQNIRNQRAESWKD